MATDSHNSTDENSEEENQRRPVSSGLDWEDIFPYDEPYNSQEEAIEELLEVPENGNVGLLEGACGTGKTLVALCVGLQAVRDPTCHIQRLMVGTSVKQQLRAFEDDLEAINENLPEGVEPFTGLTMVGKADLCAYVDTGAIDREDFYGTCEDLRDTVRNVGAGMEGDEAAGAYNELAGEATVSESSGYKTTSTEEWDSSYQEEVPSVDGNDFCPFYANYRARLAETEDDEQLMSFAPAGATGVEKRRASVLTPERMMVRAAQQGMCPHAVMRTLIPEADVIIGNYMHSFEPLTRKTMTGGVIDSETMFIGDEAHMLVPRVRDLLGDEIALSTLREAYKELEMHVLDNSNDRANALIERKLREAGIGYGTVRKFQTLIKKVGHWLRANAANELRGEDEDNPEYPLRDPEATSEKDSLACFLTDADLQSEAANAKGVSQAVADTLQEVSSELGSYTHNDTVVDGVGRVITEWFNVANDASVRRQYFQMIEAERLHSNHEGSDFYSVAGEGNLYEAAEDIDPADADELPSEAKQYSAKLSLKNLIPSDKIADTLDEFGSAMLMSATLAPMDVYREESGISELEDRGRDVHEVVKGLPFPEENRESFAVEADKYTYKNRGSTRQNNSTRHQYADVIKATATTTPGNVLVAMPSYAEAEWAAEQLKRDRQVSKKVLVDESSSNDETEALKDEFFSGGGKVLVTALRGTLVEGVDYDGDKLASCVICGVPIRSIAGPVPTAIKTAYSDRFGSSRAFDYSFSVPATRKSRQAIGRVLRGSDEEGVRVLCDKRYADENDWQNVRQYFPDEEAKEFTPTPPEALESRLNEFW